MMEHASVSARKTALDNPETLALQQRGGPRNFVEDLLLPSLQRHQQAVDEAIAAGEITPAQATDPTHRALAAQAEFWGGGEAGGGAKARADARAAGTSAGMPRTPDRLRAVEAARVQARLGGAYRGTRLGGNLSGFKSSGTSGTQLSLPGMEHLASTRSGHEQLTYPVLTSPA
jgi:hypothetical protein